MESTPEQTAAAVERFDCPACGAEAGSPCRTHSGNTAFKYHTPRFIRVPELRDAVEVDVPPDRVPGEPWKPGAESRRAVRIGYAAGAAASAELESQLDALRRAGCARIFAEDVPVRVKARPELERALRLAHETAESADRAVVVTVDELSRSARNTAELMNLSSVLQAGGIRLEILTGALAGIHDPSAPGPTMFAVLAAAARLDRDHIRDKSLEGRREAAAKGRSGGRPRVFDDDMLAAARALRDDGVPVPEIAARLTITNGRNAGRHPSLASVYRALAEPAATTLEESPTESRPR